MKLVFQWSKPLQLALCCPSCPGLTYWHACSFLKCHVDITLIYTLPYPIPLFSIIIMTLYSPSRIAKHTQNLLCKTFLTWLIKYSCNMWMATSNFFLGLQQEECGFQISNESFISWDNWTFSIICLFDSKLLVFISLFLKFTFLFHFLPNKQNKITFFFSLS